MAHPGVTSASGIDSIDAGRKNGEELFDWLIYTNYI